MCSKFNTNTEISQDKREIGNIAFFLNNNDSAEKDWSDKTIGVSDGPFPTTLPP
jgi:hypothetical protein